MQTTFFTRLRQWFGRRSPVDLDIKAHQPKNLGRASQESSKRDMNDLQPARDGQLPVGTIVIGCSNEWVPMVSGTIKGYDGRFGNIPFIDDWIRGEEVMCFSALTVYSDDVFSRLVLLNPYERFNLVAEHWEISMDKPKLETDISIEEYVTRVGVGLAKLGVTVSEPGPLA